jgi:hypothetical protein
MIRLKMGTWFPAFLVVLFVCAGSGLAADIGGTISTTLTITEDSQLVDDVTCTVTGTPCIAIGAPHVTLELNGFTMTGQADPQTGCNGAPTNYAPPATEDGIAVNAQTDVAIHGPGLIQQFRNAGIFILGSTGVRVAGVTLSTNCSSGILVGGGSDHDFRGNVSVRNGSPNFACGGI